VCQGFLLLLEAGSIPGGVKLCTRTWLWPTLSHSHTSQTRAGVALFPQGHPAQMSCWPPGRSLSSAGSWHTLGPPQGVRRGGLRAELPAQGLRGEGALTRWPSLLNAEKPWGMEVLEMSSGSGPCNVHNPEIAGPGGAEAAHP